LGKDQEVHAMKKQPELTAQTQENLKEAFWKIYCEKPIEKVTVKEITAKAGYNRSTFYAYFSDVYEVLEQIEAAVLPGEKDINHLRLSDISVSTLPIDTFTRIFEKNRKYYIVLFGENGDPAFQSKFKNYMKTMLIQHLGEQGIGISFEIDFILEYTLSGMIGALTYWFRLKDIPSSEKLFELLGELIHYGIIRRFSVEGHGGHQI
jgi:hypothetical protein